MLTQQSAAYIDSRPVNEHDSNVGFCKLDVRHVSERFCLKNCESNVCYHYPFSRQKKTAALNRKNLYTRKLAWLRELFGGFCWFCHSKEKLEFAHITPNGLSGPGRGQPERFYDIVKHPDNYFLGCHNCHKKYDVGELTLAELKF